MNTTTNDPTFAPLIAAVLRARERTGCKDLAIAVRGDRCAVVLRFQYTRRTGAFSHYVTAFLPVTRIPMLADQVDKFTADGVLAHFQIALSISKDVERYLAIGHALQRLRYELLRQPVAGEGSECWPA